MDRKFELNLSHNFDSWTAVTIPDASTATIRTTTASSSSKAVSERTLNFYQLPLFVTSLNYGLFFASFQTFVSPQVFRVSGAQAKAFHFTRFLPCLPALLSGLDRHPPAVQNQLCSGPGKRSAQDQLVRPALRTQLVNRNINFSLEENFGMRVRIIKECHVRRMMADPVSFIRLM